MQAFKLFCQTGVFSAITSNIVHRRNDIIIMFRRQNTATVVFNVIVAVIAES